MKKLMMILACATLVVAGAQAEEVTVKASVAGKNNSQTKNDCRKQAKKLAVRKFLNRLDTNMQESLVEKAVASYSKWTDDITGDDWEWEDDELSCEFSVTVNDEELLQFLSTNGWSVNKGSAADGDAVKLEVVIAEEKPDSGMMDVAKQMGVGTGGKAEFFKRYTMFQRHVRDALKKQAEEIGVDVKRLEKEKVFADMIKEDPVLVGGTFNVDNGEWQFTPDFVETIRAKNPNTLLLYYRIDTIAYDVSRRVIRVSVSLNIHYLGGEGECSLGAQGYEQKASSDQLDILMDDMAVAVTRATGMLMRGEGMNEKFKDLATKVRSQVASLKGPMKVVITGVKLDKNNRDDILLDVQDGLVNAGLWEEKKIESNGDTISCEITSADPKMKDPRRLWRAIKKVLIEAGIDEEKVTDEIKTVEGKTMTVTPET